MEAAYRIAIDGPVASGKGTVAPALAEKLHGFYLPTGAMYRVLALFCIRNGVDLAKEDEVVGLLQQVDIEFREQHIIANDNDVTEQLKDERVSMGSSAVSVLPHVREEMIRRQQGVAEEFISLGKDVVAEGRDTGTKLFPDADIKIFLTATPEVRAQRRLHQLLLSSRDTTFEQVLAELMKRDEQDSSRKTDPLVKDPEEHGYVVIDNTNQEEQETIKEIIDTMKEKGLSI